MRKLLKIPTTVQRRISMEEHREPPADPDVIQLDPPAEQPVVDAGTGSTAPAVVPENSDPVDPDVSPAAPAAAAADPVEPSEPTVGDPEPAPVEEPIAAPATVEPTEPPAEDPVSVPTEDPAPGDNPEPPVDEPGSADPVDPVTDDLPPEEPIAPPAPEETPPATDPELPGDVTEPEPAPVEEPPTTDAPLTTTDVPGTEPVVDGDPSAPAAAANPEVPPVEGTPTPEPATEQVTGEMTSAWVDGVSVDAEEVKQHLQDAAAEVMDADADSSELEDAAVALEELHEIISESLAEENPVVSETTVNLVKIEAEDALEKIGEVINIPSLESEQSPVDNLRLAMEAIGDKIKEIWEAVKAAFIKASRAVIAFFKTIFDSAYRLKASVEKLRKSISALNADDAPAEKEITAQEIVNGVAAKNIKTPQQLVSALGKLDGALGSFLGKSPDAIRKAVLGASNRFLELVTGKDEGVDVRLAVGANFGNLLANYAKLGTGLAEHVAEGSKKAKDTEANRMFNNVTGIVSVESGQLPGGYVLSAAEFGERTGWQTQTQIRALANGRFISVKRNEVDVKSFPVADEKTMLTILDHVDSLLAAIISHKESIGQFEKDTDNFSREVERGLKDAVEGNLSATELAGNARALAGFGPSLTRQSGALVGLGVSICSDVIKYITTCGKLYPSFGNIIEGSATDVPEPGTAVMA